jgi:hypothetical protein
VKNLSDDRWVQLGRSRIVSTDGGEFRSSGGTLGADRVTSSAVLAGNVAFQGSLQFAQAKSVSAIKLLEIGFMFMSAESHSVKFIDVQLQ